jgi:hypothetical protein
MEFNLSSSDSGFLGAYGRAMLQHQSNLKKNLAHRLERARAQGDQKLITLLQEELKQLNLADS